MYPHLIVDRVVSLSARRYTERQVVAEDRRVLVQRAQRVERRRAVGRETLPSGGAARDRVSGPLRVPHARGLAAGRVGRVGAGHGPPAEPRGLPAAAARRVRARPARAGGRQEHCSSCRSSVGCC